MWRVLREHVEGHERACEGSREKVLQSRKASTAKNMTFLEEKQAGAELCQAQPQAVLTGCPLANDQN